MPLGMSGSHTQHSQPQSHHSHQNQSAYHSVAAQSRVQQPNGQAPVGGGGQGTLVSGGLFSQTLANGSAGSVA